MNREKICGIYCIENSVNGKKYIGLSSNIYDRWSRHKRALNAGKHINAHLQSAWVEYGADNFNFYIIERCNKDEIKERERFYIKVFNSMNRQYGYNNTSGGDGVRDLSPESRDKISKGESLKPVIQLSLNGEYISEYRNCAKASVGVCGDISYTENIRSCCNNAYGRKSSMGYLWIYKENYDPNIQYKYAIKKLYKPVCMYTEDGVFVASFDSTIVAEQITGIGHKLISACCCGDKRIAKGYIWRLDGDPFDKYPTKRKYDKN